MNNSDHSYWSSLRFPLDLYQQFGMVRETLGELRTVELVNLRDVRKVAETMLGAYYKTMDCVDEAVRVARWEADKLNKTFLETHNVGYGSPKERCNAFYANHVGPGIKQALDIVEQEAEGKKREVLQVLQASHNPYIDVRTSRGMIIFKTTEGEYGVKLDGSKNIRKARPVKTPLGILFYKLGEEVTVEEYPLTLD